LRIARYRNDLLTIALAACLLLAPACLEPACAGSCDATETHAAFVIATADLLPHPGEMPARPVGAAPPRRCAAASLRDVGRLRVAPVGPGVLPIRI
jgi:hypothetical protein